MDKNVTADVVNKYLDYYFVKLNVDESVQPNLRNAICMVCENPKMRINAQLLGLNNNIYIRKSILSYVPMSLISEDIQTIEDVVEYFANLILYQESRKFKNYEFFELEERVDKLEKILKPIAKIYNPYEL